MTTYETNLKQDFDFRKNRRENIYCSILQRIEKQIIYLDLCEDLSFEMVGWPRPLKPPASRE